MVLGELPWELVELPWDKPVRLASVRFGSGETGKVSRSANVNGA